MNNGYDPARYASPARSGGRDRARGCALIPVRMHRGVCGSPVGDRVKNDNVVPGACCRVKGDVLVTGGTGNAGVVARGLPVSRQRKSPDRQARALSLWGLVSDVVFVVVII